MANKCPIKVDLNDEYYIFEAQGQFSLMQRTKTIMQVPGKRRREEVTKKKVTYHGSLMGCVEYLLKYEWTGKEAETIEELRQCAVEINKSLKLMIEKMKYVTETTSD